MDKRKIKYSYFDLDGTLLNNDKKISNSTIKAIDILRKKNIKIGIATGRPFILTKNIIEIIKPELPTISINGGLVINTNDSIIFNKFIEEKTKEKILKFLINGKVDFLVYTNDKIYFSNVTNPPWFDFLKKEIKKNLKNNEKIIDIVHIKKEKINKILIINKNSTDIKKENILNYLSKFKNTYIVKSQSGVFDIMPKNVTKGEALLKLHKGKYINLKETMTWGDADNDISMFDASYLSISMPNSNLNVKSKSNINLKENNQNHIYNFVIKNWG